MAKKKKQRNNDDISDIENFEDESGDIEDTEIESPDSNIFTSLSSGEIREEPIEEFNPNIGPAEIKEVHPRHALIVPEAIKAYSEKDWIPIICLVTDRKRIGPRVWSLQKGCKVRLPRSVAEIFVNGGKARFPVVGE